MQNFVLFLENKIVGLIVGGIKGVYLGIYKGLMIVMPVNELFLTKNIYDMSESFSPNNSFEIKNSKDFFEKLRDEYYDFDKAHLNPRHAINCAITSWHLTDWTYQEFFKTDSRFQDSKENGKKYLVYQNIRNI
jgi:hypothetical protein